MLVLPAVRDSGEYDLFIVLQDDNIERMKAHDPAMVPAKEIPVCQNLFPYSIVVCYATEAECAEIQKMAQAGKIGEVIKNLVRGFEFRPDLGDHDFGPISILNKPQG